MAMRSGLLAVAACGTLLLAGCGGGSGSGDGNETPDGGHGVLPESGIESPAPAPGVTPAAPEDLTSTGPVAGQATLFWAPPAERANGTPLAISELSGYRLYMALENAEPIHVDLGDPGQTQMTLEGLAPGHYRFWVSAIDRADLESRPSNILEKQVH